MVAPVRISFDAAAVRIENRHDVRDLAHLRFPWAIEREGVAVAGGELEVGPLPAGASAVLPLPELPADAGEAWLTVRAVLASDEPWAPAGHEVAWGQCELAAAPPPAAASPRGLPPGTAGEFAGGVLRRLESLALIGPRLDVWRAPTDNDEGYHGPEQLARAWREHGLHRMHHRTLELRETPGALVLRTRVAAAASDLALLATYRWTAAEDGALALALDVVPDGDWRFPLPRLGVRFAIPRAHARVEWLGLGPGEAYADSRAAARVGRFVRDIDALQTPYLMPQENGSRAAVRWAELTDGAGRGLRLEGRPQFGLTVRPWTSEALAAARHPTDLERDPEWLWINADLGAERARLGVVRARRARRHRLEPAPAALGLVFREL